MRLCLLVLFLAGCSSSIDRPAGILVADAPVQTRIEEPRLFLHKGLAVRPVAEFSAAARVLSTEWYRGGDEGRLAPVDLAVGWGRMSDSAVLEHMDIDQHNRFYFWQRDQNAPAHLALSKLDVVKQSTNIHVIPASDALAGQLRSVKPGHVVQLEGRLVNVKLSNGANWRSSTSRTDVGNGACELLFLESLVVE
ncbi:MAG: hypothetical protein AAGI08_09910 [Bacteroidota bacterium]